MKLLFVNAVNPGKTIENIYPPLGPAYIASYLRKHLDNIEIRLIEGNVEEELSKFAPDLVGISSVTQNFNIAASIAGMCKRMEIPVIIGGTHISTLPATIAPEMDLAIIGEGEQTMLEVVERFMRCGMDPEQMKDIPGIAFRKGAGSMHISEDRALIDPIDTIPLPARDLLRIPQRGQIYLFSSRGCPHRCTFCQSTRFFNKTRSFSAEYVVDELEYLIKEYRPVSICFYDDIFITNKGRLRKIVELIERRGIQRKVEFYVNVRAAQADEEIASLLKRMNVTTVDMGLESGTDKVLHYLKGKSVSVEKNTRAIEIFNNAGMRTNGTFIIGAPDETVEDIMQTYNFIKKSALSYFATYILVPLPNTPLWEYAKERGLVSEPMEWEQLKMEITENFSDRIILSELDKNVLYQLYMKFEKLQKKRRLASWIRRGINEPAMIFPFIVKKISLWITNRRQPIG